MSQEYQISLLLIMAGSIVQRNSRNLAWNGLLCTKHHRLTIQKGNSYANRAVGVVKEMYSKCKDDFLLGLLVHRSTPLLYPNAKSPAELFPGHKIATNIPYIPFGTAALMQRLRSDDHDYECRFDPNDGDSLCKNISQ